MKLLSFFQKKHTPLIFSLICGLAYLIIILSFITRNTSAGGLIIFFFFPAIVCGSALLIFKAIKTHIENKSTKSLWTLFSGHVAVILLALLLLAEMLIS